MTSMQGYTACSCSGLTTEFDAMIHLSELIMPLVASHAYTCIIFCSLFAHASTNEKA